MNNINITNSNYYKNSFKSKQSIDNYNDNDNDNNKMSKNIPSAKTNIGKIIGSTAGVCLTIPFISYYWNNTLIPVTENLYPELANNKKAVNKKTFKIHKNTLLKESFLGLNETLPPLFLIGLFVDKLINNKKSNPIENNTNNENTKKSNIGKISGMLAYISWFACILFNQRNEIKKLEKNPVMIGSNFLSLTKFISVGAIIGSGIDFLIDKYREKNT